MLDVMMVIFFPLVLVFCIILDQLLLGLCQEMYLNN